MLDVLNPVGVMSNLLQVKILRLFVMLPKNCITMFDHSHGTQE
jgi:hypothetical protein